VKQVTSNWLVELGEIDSTFRKSDVAQLKAFITRDRDVFRRAYARRESVYARKTVFFASVNPQFYLNDPTGNRRFWTVECTALDHSHGLDMQQVWAEFLHLYKQGEGFYLTSDEFQALNTLNEEFTSIDPIQEKIERLYDWGAPDLMWRDMTATEALIAVGFDRPTKADVTRAGMILRKMNGGITTRTRQGRLIKVPPLLKDN
jgi:putative DNA primase/helicase